MAYLKINNAGVGYQLNGKDVEGNGHYIREFYDENQLTDLFDRVIALNTPFTAVSEIIAEWIFRGYPMELLSLQSVKKDPGFAHTVLKNLYSFAEAMKDAGVLIKDARVRIYENGVFVIRCAKVPGVYHIPLMESFEMYTGRSLADLEFAGTTFATAEEARKFIANACALKRASTPAEQAAIDWIQQATDKEFRDKKHEQRKAFLDLKAEGIYLLSTESDWLYAPGIDRETLISKLKNVCKNTSSGEAEKTSVFG